jgi:hypothetical protein
MKNLKLLILVLTLFVINSCTVTSEMTSNAMSYAIMGKREMDIYYRVGSPTVIIQTPDGGKIMRYEWASVGMMPTPSMTRSTTNFNGNVSSPYNPYGGTYITGTVNTNSSSRSYTPYQKTSYLEVFLNKQGKCVHFQYKMPQYQLEEFYNRFKGYIPKESKRK